MSLIINNIKIKVKDNKETKKIMTKSIYLQLTQSKRTNQKET